MPNEPTEEGGGLSLSEDVLADLAGRVADLLRPNLSPAPEPAAAPRGSERLIDSSPVFNQFADEIRQEQTNALAPLYTRMALEEVQRTVPAHQLGTQGFALIQEELGKLNGSQIKQLIETGALSTFAKSVAFDMVMSGKSSMQPNPGVSTPSGDPHAGTPQRVEDLPAAVRADIAEAERLRGRPFTLDELREDGLLS